MPAEKKPISTPVAIFVGSVVIAAGLFFGVRSGRDQAPSIPLAAAPSTISQPAATLPANSTPPPREAPAAAAPVAARDVVTQQAQTALDRQKALLVDKCMRSLPRPDGGPDEVRLTFNVTFAADGSQLARGVSEQRGYSRPEVTRCVTDSLQPLHISPPGANTQVDISLTLR